MNTLQLVNGDLVIGKGGFAMLSGAEKVRQDLSLAVTEALGVDRFHSGWGSQLPDYIGSSDDMIEASIQAEVGRVVQNYVAVQMGQMQTDALTGQPSRFTTSEIVRGISNIVVTPTFDAIYVKVVVATMAGEDVTVLDTTLGTTL